MLWVYYSNGFTIDHIFFHRHTDDMSCSKEDLVHILLSRNADVNKQDKLGKCALMYACASNLSVTVIALLLKHGADPRLTDRNGETVLMHAAQSTNREVLPMVARACIAWGKEVIIINVDKTDPTESVELRGASESDNKDALFGSCGSLHIVHYRTNEVGSESISKPKERHILRKSLSLKTQNETLQGTALSKNLHRVPEIRQNRRSTRLRQLIRHNSTNTWNVEEIMRGGDNLCDLHESGASDNNLGRSTESLSGRDNRVCSNVTLLTEKSWLTRTMNSGLDSRSTGSLPDICQEAQEFLLRDNFRTASCSSNSSDRLIGPGGRVLSRQGSGTKLNDVISITRPGLLPPLNVNNKPPIPDIGATNT